MEIRQLIEIEDFDVVSVSPQTSVREAAKILNNKNIGCVIVIDDLKKVKGIISERDIVRCIAEHRDEMIEKPVSQIMSSELWICDLDSSVEALITDVKKHRIRHLPVMDGDILAGVVALVDLLDLRIAAAEYGETGRLDGLFQKKGVRRL
jgi:CBS domain-containing protein